MSKLIGLATFAAAFLAASPAPSAVERHVHGVITALDRSTVTIASAHKAVTGRIDPERTKITVHGRPAHAADLEITDHAKAELCLDDVWLSIDAH